MSATLLQGQADEGSFEAGIGTRVRRYLVDAPAATALNDGDLPDEGDAHPVFSGLFARRFAVELASPTHSIVAVTYTNSSSWRRKGDVDDLASDYHSWTTTYESVNVKLPSLKATQHDFPDLSGSSPISKTVWVPETWESRETRMIFTLRISDTVTNLTKSTIALSFAEYALVRAEADKLHTINGVQVRFRPRLIDQQSPNEYVIQYEWEFDPGTLKPLGSASGFATIDSDAIGISGKVAFPWYASGSLVRRPYHRIIVVPDPTDVEARPVFQQVLDYEQNATGWQSLPGIA